MQEFTCTDCGCDTLLFLDVPCEPRRCGTCQFIADIADPDDREDIRARLYDAAAMSFWLRCGLPAAAARKPPRGA